MEQKKKQRTKKQNKKTNKKKKTTTIVVDCHMRYCGSKHFCTLSHFSLFLEYYGKLLCSSKQKNDHIEYTRKINK